MRRTMYCGEVRKENINQKTVFCGWVKSKRDMGGVIFLDLADREGVLQVVCDRAHLSSEVFTLAERLADQSVIEVAGTIRERSAETYNDRLPTGTVELRAESLRLLSSAKPLPFPLEDGGAVREELRLKYRYLDLRRPEMYDILRFRHRLQMTAEKFLSDRGFISVETPTLTKSTPEGARDYLVPNRTHPGSFYALPQSPQIFKQLLMVGGVDRYYQIARCYRDEDLRADRQPEFTQLDLEMSFVEQADVLKLVESLFKELFRELSNISFEAPFRRMTWLEVMDRYGSDKPDLRYGLPIVELSDWAKKSGFKVFREAVDTGGVVRAINIPNGAQLARSDIDRLTSLAQKNGAKGMAWIEMLPDGTPHSVLTKFFSESELDELMARTKSEHGDLIVFCADRLEIARKVLGTLRQDIARQMELVDESKFEMLIVTDFPLFEWSKDEKRYVAMHHPFTMPRPDDMMYLESDPEKVRALAYDFVLNGVELGSGSIRIHDGEIQRRVFETLGFSKEEIARRFGFFVDAFQYGTPPHGGFAFGIDRLVMLMTGAKSLRDVIAFPKMKDGSDAMTEAPSPVDEDQLEILGLLGLPTRGKRVDMKREREAVKIEIDEIAALAMLEISEQEKEGYASEMQAILSFAAEINQYDLDDVAPTAHIAAMTNVFRADTVEPSLSQGDILQNAKTTKDGFILVPSVIEKQEG